MRGLSSSVVGFFSFMAVPAAVITWQLSIARGAPVHLTEGEKMNAVASAEIIGFIRTARGDALPLACSICSIYLLSG